MELDHPSSKSGDLARNLQENQLGGVIFGCKNMDTIEDCFRKQLFGLHSIHYSYVRNIKPGLPLFLFNYSDRKLHGLFEAASLGQISIDPCACSKDGSFSTALPAQVQIRTKTQYPPLLEIQFKKVLVDNYYNHHHFYFELGHVQTTALISLFKKQAAACFNLVPAVSSKRSLVVSPVKASVVPQSQKLKTNSKDATNPFGILSDASGFISGRWVDLADSDAGNASVSEKSHINTGKKGSRLVISDWDDLDDDVLGNEFDPHSNPDVVSPSSLVKTVDQVMEPVECNLPVVNTVNGETNSFTAANVEAIEIAVYSSPVGEGLNSERLTILNRLKELSSLWPQSTPSAQDFIDYTSNQCVPEEKQVNADLCSDPFGATMEDRNLFQESHGNAELLQIIADLAKRTEELEKKQIGSDQHIHSLNEVVEDSGITVQHLEYLDELQFEFDSLLSHLGSMCNNLAKPSVFLISGYHGVTWLSSLDSLTPDKDILVGLTPMGNARSYPSSVALDSHIFALGSGDGMSWYNTVECYSLMNNEWTEWPLLNHMKGSLARITLNEKIYAIGGDVNETFSEVEVFDPYLGKWICKVSILFSRFALAAAVMNGVIYTAGGYDGSMYLSSAERYDPRKGFWVKLPSMSTRRGCYALTVMGEALHGMGGYDGKSMVSNVEIYDPRLNAWRMVDPMHTPRGYAFHDMLSGFNITFKLLRSDAPTPPFLKHVTVIKFVDILNVCDRARPLSGRDLLKLQKELRGAQIETRYEWDQISRYEIPGITPIPMSQTILPFHQNRKKTAIQYFWEKYGCVLKYASWSCLQAGSDCRPIYLPMEVRKTVEGQRYPKKKVTESEREQQLTSTVRTTCEHPQEREQSIPDMVLHNKDTVIDQASIPSASEVPKIVFGADHSQGEPSVSSIVTVFVCVYDKRIPMSVNLRKNTVAEVVRAALFKRKIRVKDAYLYFEGRCIDGNCTLDSLPIGRDSNIYLGPRTRGGMPFSIFQTFFCESLQTMLLNNALILFDVILLPPELMLIGDQHPANTVIYFWAAFTRYLIHRLLVFVFFDGHLQQICWQGNFGIGHVAVSSDGQVLINRTSVAYTPAGAAADCRQIYYIIQDFLLIPFTHGYPVHVEFLLNLLLNYDEHLYGNRDFLTFLVNFPCLQSHAEKQKWYDQIDLKIQQLNHGQLGNLRAVFTNPLLLGWQTYISHVPALMNTFMYNAVFDPIAQAYISVYTPHLDQGFHLGRNFLRHPPVGVTPEVAEAALSYLLDHLLSIFVLSLVVDFPGPPGWNLMEIISNSNSDKSRFYA